jgi:hypothetical protein
MRKHLALLTNVVSGFKYFSEALLMFLMHLHKRIELSMYHFTGSILHVLYLYFPKGGGISIMSKTNIESNSNEYY